MSVWGGSDGLTFLSSTGQNLPQGGYHSDNQSRLRVRYDFAQADGGAAAHGCNGTINPCLNVLFRSIDPSNGAWNFWERESGPNFGLDRWATDAASLARVNVEDQPNANPNNGLPNSWNCNATSDSAAPFNSPEESTAYDRGRRWDWAAPTQVRTRPTRAR